MEKKHIFTVRRSDLQEVVSLARRVSDERVHIHAHFQVEDGRVVMEGLWKIDRLAQCKCTEPLFSPPSFLTVDLAPADASLESISSELKEKLGTTNYNFALTIV